MCRRDLTPVADADRACHAPAGIDNYRNLCLCFLESDLPEEIDAALDFEDESLSDLNEMCGAIEPLNQTDREKLGAVVSFSGPEQAGQITELAKNLGQELSV